MSVTKAREQLNARRKELADATAALERMERDLPGLRNAIDIATNDFKRGLAERRFDEHQERIARLRAEIADLDLAVTGAEQHVERMKELAPALRATRKQIVALGADVDAEAAALDKDINSILKRVANLQRLGSEMVSLSSVANESWYPFSPQKFSETIGGVLWSRLGSLGGLPFPGGGKRPDLKKFFSGWTVYLDKEDAA